MYRVTIESGPHAGAVAEGTTLEAAIDCLRQVAPGITDTDCWWAYVTPNGVRHQCVVWGEYSTADHVEDMDGITCRYCNAHITGTDARHRYGWEGHRGGGCLDGDAYLDEAMGRV